jgi:hypothetical protein
MGTKRAERRAALARIKRRVARYYGGYAAGDLRATGRLAQARTPCSCWMCANPRRYGYLTRQEMLAR